MSGKRGEGNEVFDLYEECMEWNSLDTELVFMSIHACMESALLQRVLCCASVNRSSVMHPYTCT